jgi:hypothetical protein
MAGSRLRPSGGAANPLGRPDEAVEQETRLAYDVQPPVSKRRTREEWMEVLFIAFGWLAFIWIAVLLGSRFFGPK